jgi:hypothetical protein
MPNDKLTKLPPDEREPAVVPESDLKKGERRRAGVDVQDEKTE